MFCCITTLVHAQDLRTKMSHCNIRNISLKVQCLDSHHLPCGQRSGSSERQVRVCQFPGNCITHRCGDDCGYLSGSLVSSTQVGYKSMIKFWKVIKCSVSIPSKENTYHGILTRQTRYQPAVLGDERRALYKPTLSTRAFQDHNEARDRQETSPLSFFTMISLGRPQAHRKQLVFALHLFPHDFRKKLQPQSCSSPTVRPFTLKTKQ